MHAQKRLRHSYVGEWLPEPVQTGRPLDAEQQILLSENLTTAFLLILETLSPKERAAYLLRDIFSSDYQDIATGLQLSQSACRQLVSRARKRLKTAPYQSPPTPQKQEKLVAAFHDAIKAGNIESLKSLLARDVTLQADSGGKATAISKPIVGPKAVAKFFDKVLVPVWRANQVNLEMRQLNGQPALVLYENGALTTTISFAYDSLHKTRAIHFMRNPEKLQRLDRTFPKSAL